MLLRLGRLPRGEPFQTRPGEKLPSGPVELLDFKNGELLPTGEHVRAYCLQAAPLRTVDPVTVTIGRIDNAWFVVTMSTPVAVPLTPTNQV
jgi:hypothetical protein